MTPSEKIHACCELRKKLKEEGLNHTVQLMTVEERGEARRLIREALLVLGGQLTGQL